MLEISVPAPAYPCQIAALHAAWGTALGATYLSFSGFPGAQPFIVRLIDTALAADTATALSVMSAHDPVFLSANKTQIQAGGVDAVTVTVNAPKAGAAPVTLLVSINGAAPTAWGPFVLTGGVGSDTLTSLDKGTLTISVQNPANRSTDTLVVSSV